MKFIQSLSFKIASVFIIIIAFLVLTLFFYNIYSMNILRKQVAQSYINMLPRLVEKMDDSLDVVRNYLIRTFSNNIDNADFISFYNSPKDSTEYHFSATKISRKFNSDINFFYIVDTLFVYSQKSDEIISFSLDGNRQYLADGRICYIDKNEEIKKILNKVESHGEKVNGEWQVRRLGEEYGLVNMFDDRTGGYIGAWVDIKKLLATDNLNDMGIEGNTILVSKDGHVLYSTDSKKPASDMVENNTFKLESGWQTIRDTIGGRNYLVITCKSDKSDIFIVKAVEEAAILSKLLVFQRMLFIIPIGMIVIIIIYFVFIKRILFKPMKQLMDGMKSIIGGNLNVELEEKGSREFLFLIRTFNDMISQINKLVIDVYEERLISQNAELEAKKAELGYLQLQINPHFFSNSLNIIYSLAALKDYGTIQKMSLLLSNYFRYLTQAGKKLTELRTEIALISNYLEIQKLRFTKKLTYTVSIPEKYLSYVFPALSIQPFVENSIVHGFKRGSAVLNVIIEAWADSVDPENYFVVEVNDNGGGFLQEDINNLMCDDYTGRDEARHIGIWNVRNRLRITYGELAEIRIGNNRDGGAAVKVRLPINSQAEESECIV